MDCDLEGRTFFVLVGAMLRLDVLTFRQRPSDFSLSCEGIKVTQFPIKGKVCIFRIFIYISTFQHDNVNSGQWVIDKFGYKGIFQKYSNNFAFLVL